MAKSKRNIDVVVDPDGRKIVFINDTIFKGHKTIDRSKVENYLKRYVGEFYKCAETRDIIYIGSDLPDEYAHSKYTVSLKGPIAKAKANAIQGIPEMIQISTKQKHLKNKKRKHNFDAKYGWYKLKTRFALPIYNDLGNLERYNIYNAELLVRVSNDRKMYLYDLIAIKKEVGAFSSQETLLSKKPPLSFGTSATPTND